MNNDTFSKVEQLEKRIGILEAARKEMFLANSETRFTPEMAKDYELLSEFLNNLPEQINRMLKRGISQFLLGKYCFELDDKDLVRVKLTKNKLWVPKIVLKVKYEPLNCFLKHLTFSESCGWKVNLYYNNFFNKTSIWITIFPVNPEIRQVNLAYSDGTKMKRLKKLCSFASIFFNWRGDKVRSKSLL